MVARTPLFVALLAMVLLIPSGALASAADATTAKTISDFQLRDFRGREHSLSDYQENQVVVLAFLGIECPLARIYTPRLNELAKRYAERGVAFLGVNANVQDTPTEIAAFARDYDVAFPILKDAGNTLADAVGAVRTPEVFVLDRDRAVRYRGRIDDQYGVGFQKPAATANELTAALDQLLAGEPVAIAATDAPGCFIGRVRDVEPHGEITYSNQIARILNRRCVECHREGELAPFPLATYEDVVGWAETIREVIADRRMPPWFADPQHGVFANDSSMSDEEKQAVYTWVDNGYPEGDPADLPEPPHFTPGWRIDEPDIVLEMDEPFTVAAEGTVDYQYFLIDPEFKEDVWVTAAEARPGNSAVVHHIVLFSIPASMREMAEEMIHRQRVEGVDPLDSVGRPRDRDDEDRDEAAEDGERPRRRRRGGGASAAFGQMVAIYAPGMPPWKYPEGSAMELKAGSLLVMQMHYTPNGTEQTDQSYVGLHLAEPENVTKKVRYGMAVNPAIDIPPHEDSYEAVSRVKFVRDSLLLNLFPHMHYRGKSFNFVAHYPDGTTETLLDVPAYDFNWQLRYDFAEPKPLPKGTTIVATATFDNSADNLANPDPSQRVRFGLQSWEEMMVGYYSHVPQDDDRYAPGNKGE